MTSLILSPLIASAEHGRSAAQRLCDEIAHAKQALRKTLLREQRDRLYEALTQQVQDATDDALRLAQDLRADEGWSVGFLETLVSEDPQLLERALTHGLLELWHRQTPRTLPRNDPWGLRRQAALNQALECLADTGAPRAAVHAILAMGAEPLARSEREGQPVWHTSITREAQADVERHVDVLLSEAFGIHSVEGHERLNRALDATVKDLSAVIDQDENDCNSSKTLNAPHDPDDTLRQAWTMVFQEMLETALRIGQDDNDPLSDVDHH